MEPAASFDELRHDTAPPRGERLRRSELRGVRRLVVKLGTRVLVDDLGRPRRELLESLALSVLALRRGGREVIVVTSGAVGLGRSLLGSDWTAGATDGGTADVVGRRACAAVGQAALQGLYRDTFAVHGILTAQVLLTCQDFSLRRLRPIWSTFERLLRSGVVLIVNENDAVSLGAAGNRPRFRDNDGLAALVATGCRADLLVLLTDVAGVLEPGPDGSLSGSPLDRVEDPQPLLDRLAEPAAGGVSRGGMRSKVAAAALAARAGCHTVIAAGGEWSVVERIVAGEPLGTFFPPSPVPPIP